MNQLGTLYGIGVGPGDPELLTLKAVRLIKAADIVAYLTNTRGQSLARTIAAPVLAEKVSGTELPIAVPMSTARDAANQAYDSAAQKIGEELAAGRQVAFLCEGDPFFYGSFAYLHERLQHDFPCQVVPGVSSLHAAAACAGLPLALQGEDLIVVSPRHSDAVLIDALQRHDNIVILKAGPHRARLLDLLKTAGRDSDAVYLEKITQPGEYLEAQLDRLPVTPGPYFSLFLISRRRNSR